MELLFREDPYLKSCEATVTASGPQGVRLDRTVFYPTGGGQPGDCGDLVLPDGARLRVVDAVQGDGHEDVVHLLEEGAAPPAPRPRVTSEKIGRAPCRERGGLYVEISVVRRTIKK